jgi:hypothetical protein
MEIKILNEHRNMYYYTIVGEPVPNIYSMQLTVVMLRTANEDFHGFYVGQARERHQVATIAFYHHLQGFCKPLPLLDIFQFASDPDYTDMVNHIYDAQVKHKNEKAIIPISDDFIFLHSRKRISA